VVRVGRIKQTGACGTDVNGIREPRKAVPFLREKAGRRKKTMEGHYFLPQQTGRKEANELFMATAGTSKTSKKGRGRKRLSFSRPPAKEKEKRSSSSLVEKIGGGTVPLRGISFFCRARKAREREKGGEELRGGLDLDRAA